jgi:plastocyanin
VRRLTLLAAAVVALAGCGDPDPSPPTAADLRGIDVSPDHTIVVDESGFEPSALEIAAGEVVLVVNEGDGEHSLTADDRRIDTGRMQPGDEVTLVLTEPDQVDFADLEAPDHQGTLTVTVTGE